MQQLIFKKDIEQSKMDALLHFLKSWDIEAELINNKITTKKKSDFSLSVGIWKDYNIDANELRKNAWKTNK
ncbi:MAG: hypothetical protein K1X55_09545 [Chitinophagales bacterium]|nr:hypothetical protein [Chitinophagales bacterium]